MLKHRSSILIPVYVISLARATARRERISRCLDALGVDYEIVEAVDGAALDLSDYESRLDDTALCQSRGFGLTRGEIGCFLSHYRLWERIAADNTAHALVLEDDAMLDDDFIEVINALPSIGWRWEVVRLSSFFQRTINRRLAPLGKARFLVRYRSPAEDTLAYCISLHGTRVLLRHCRVISRPVDNLYEEWWKTGMHFLAVHPPVVKPLPPDDNAINNERASAQNTKPDTRRRLQNRMIKNIERFRRYLWNAFNPPQKTR